MKVIVFVIALVASFAECEEYEIFREVSESALPNFTHRNGATGELWLPEILGPGVAFIDYDMDGLLDIWAIQGGPLFDEGVNKRSDQLFRNVSKNGMLLFQRVSDEAEVHATGYGMGLATGDVDRDGDTDVFLANFGPNELWLNQGDGSFSKSTFGNGMEDPGDWSVSASFIDVNQDGMLDLYVANYVDFKLTNHKVCLGISNKPDYCAPTAYPATGDRLYMNTGKGGFVERTDAYGVRLKHGAGLGVISKDFNQDGFLDLYVANDPTSNFLWRNNAGEGFLEVAMNTGVAVNIDGKPEASMGVVSEDFDRDCDDDLFMTNLTSETNTLFKNSGQSWYADATNQAGLGATSLPYTGFGVGWIDLELDGDVDLVTVNGAVSYVANASAGLPLVPLGQRNQIWLLDDSGRYSERLNDPFSQAVESSRGAAFGDLDNDGDIDVIVSNNAGPLRLFENVSNQDNNWLGLLVKEKNSVAYNARVELVGKKCVSKTVRTDGSYASANDPRVIFGLGKTTESPIVQVTWTDGKTNRFGPLAINQYHFLNR